MSQSFMTAIIYGLKARSTINSPSKSILKLGASFWPPVNSFLTIWLIFPHCVLHLSPNLV